MIERRRLVAILAAIIPITAGCNAILGIESHALAPDGGNGGASGSPGPGCGGVGAAEDVVAAAGTKCGFTMPNPVGAGLPNAASYTQNVDGTVTDKVTGLTWEGEVDSAHFTRAGAIKHCNELKDAGGGWRLPTRVELVSLVDFTRPGPTISATFKTRPPEKFWTSSRGACDPTVGWFVDFDDGSTHQTAKTDDPFRARCVRGAPSRCSTTRYQVQVDGSVLDAATGLTWQRTVAQKQSWADAMTFCRALGTASRLPSLTEVQSIVDDTKENPPIDGDAFPNTPIGFFWTSSPQAGDRGAAWMVTSIHGHTAPEPVTSTFFVRCVR